MHLSIGDLPIMNTAYDPRRSRNRRLPGNIGIDIDSAPFHGLGNRLCEFRTDFEESSNECGVRPDQRPGRGALMLSIIQAPLAFFRSQKASLI